MVVFIIAKTLVTIRIAKNILAWYSSPRLLPVNAIHTEEFIQDTDKLHKSLNGKKLDISNIQTFSKMWSPPTAHFSGNKSISDYYWDIVTS